MTVAVLILWQWTIFLLGVYPLNVASGRPEATWALEVDGSTPRFSSLVDLVAYLAKEPEPAQRSANASLRLIFGRQSGVALRPLDRT